jgi:oligopeptide transport system substrate-binding protein
MLRKLIPIIALFAATQVRAENQFRVRLVADPHTFDWNLATTSMETPIMMNIMEGLFEFDKAMKPKPLLAKSWSVSPDGKTYLFKIRTDVRWSDGKALSAHDFVYSWRRLLDPLTAASYAYLLFDVEGAEDFNGGKFSDFDKVGIKAIDASTLQVRLRKPISYFLQMFTFWVTFPMREDQVQKYGPAWSQPGNAVVLGPFIPASYQPQTQILLKRNELYHGSKPQADSVLMRIINEDTTALNLFKIGQLDYVRPINFLEMGALRSTPAFHTDRYYRTCFLNINTKKYPFNLPKARQALAKAIDKSRLAQVMHQTIVSADSFIDPALFPEGKNSCFSFDPDGAKKLLSEIGLDGATMPRVELYAYASDENALLTQFIQEQLRKNMGLNVQIQMPEFKMFRTQLELGTGAIYFRCWGADYADPDAYVSMFLSSSGNSRTGWQNPAYDEAVKKAASVSTGPERTRLYKQALQILLKDDAVIVPLYYDALTYLLDPRIKNFTLNPLNYVFFKDITFNGGGR